MWTSPWKPLRASKFAHAYCKKRTCLRTVWEVTWKQNFFTPMVYQILFRVMALRSFAVDARELRGWFCSIFLWCRSSRKLVILFVVLQQLLLSWREGLLFLLFVLLYEASLGNEKKTSRRKRFRPWLCFVYWSDIMNKMKFVNHVYSLLNIPTSMFLCPFELHESYVWAAD